MTGADTQPMALSSVQCQRLADILTRPLLLAAKAPGVVVRLQPDHFITTLIAALVEAGVGIAGVRLEGSAATYCMAAKECYFSDLDLAFYLEDNAYETLCQVRDVLLGYLKSNVTALAEMDPFAIAHCYISKMFITPKPCTPSGDAWALFSFSGCPGFPSLDLKFVQRIRSPYQFSVNSLQIVLPMPCNAQQLFSLDVFCESFYGPLSEVLRHAQENIIAVTTEPAVLQLHGGGLLKYAALLSQGYRVADHLAQSKLEHFMISAFQRDYLPDAANQYNVPVQLQRIFDFLFTHMPNQPAEQYNFVLALEDITLRQMVHQSGYHFFKVVKWFVAWAARLLRFVQTVQLQRTQAMLTRLADETGPGAAFAARIGGLPWTPAPGMPAIHSAAPVDDSFHSLATCAPLETATTLPAGANVDRTEGAPAAMTFAQAANRKPSKQGKKGKGKAATPLDGPPPTEVSLASMPEPISGGAAIVSRQHGSGEVVSNLNGNLAADGNAVCPQPSEMVQGAPWEPLLLEEMMPASLDVHERPVSDSAAWSYNSGCSSPPSSACMEDCHCDSGAISDASSCDGDAPLASSSSKLVCSEENLRQLQAQLGECHRCHDGTRREEIIYNKRLSEITNQECR